VRLFETFRVAEGPFGRNLEQDLAVEFVAGTQLVENGVGRAFVTLAQRLERVELGF